MTSHAFQEAARMKLAPLCQEDEAQAFVKMRGGCDESKELLVRANIGLVMSISKNFYNANNDELVSAGIFALLRAIESYDISRGNKFSSYAYRAIHNEMGSLVRKEVRWHSLHAQEEASSEGLSGSFEDPLDNKEFAGALIKNSGLLPVEAVIVKRHFGIDCEPSNLSQLARELKVSPEWVRKLKNRALEKMRESIINEENDDAS